MDEQKVEQVNFGVSILLNGEVKGNELTGIYPSPSHPTLESVVEAAVDYLNRYLGTKMAALRVYSEDEVEEVDVGTFVLKE